MSDTPDTPADDVGVLFPDVDVTVRDPDTGEDTPLTVREFRLLEGLRAQAEARDLLAALSECARIPDDDDMGLSVSIDAAIGDHPEGWIRLLARATGREADWISRLSDADGHALKDAMWTANGPFFLRRIVDALKAAASASRFRESLPISSPQGTDETNQRSPDASPGGRSNSPGGTNRRDDGSSPPSSP